MFHNVPRAAQTSPRRRYPTPWLRRCMSHSGAVHHLGPTSGRHPSTDVLYIEAHSCCSVCNVLFIISIGKNTGSNCGQIVSFLVESNVLLGRENVSLNSTIVALKFIKVCCVAPLFWIKAPALDSIWCIDNVGNGIVLLNNKGYNTMILVSLYRFPETFLKPS